MKNRTVYFFCLMLMSCSLQATGKSEQAITPDSLENVALRYLFERLNESQKATIKDNQIQIGKTSIRLKIAVEFDVPKDDKWIYAARISTYYTTDKETQINVGSLGVGSTRKEAISVCVKEWFSLFGIPFTDMLKGDPGIREVNMNVFPGLMGIRGKLPENTWLKGDTEMNKIIISKIQELIKKEPTDFVVLDIKLVIRKNGFFDGECRINNNVSEQLLDALKELDWPLPDDVFLFKQFYLVDKAKK